MSIRTVRAANQTENDRPRDYHLEHGLTGPAVMAAVSKRILEAETTLHKMVLDKRITGEGPNARALWLRAHIGGLREQFEELVQHEMLRIEKEHFYSTAPKKRTKSKKRAQRKAPRR